MKPATMIAVLLFAVALPAPAKAQSPLPSGTRWLEHLSNELLPFWTSNAALGNPVGAFPATRCDSAALYDEKRPCPEVMDNPWISPQERHLVAMSRQVYGYGVAFHLTGRGAYLDAMKAGVDFIRQNAMDRVNGGMKTTQNITDGSWGPAPEFRNPQELGYGLLGLALYYYLTRDADVLQDILAVKNYIFEQYYNRSSGALRWLPKSSETANAGDKQLAAQLDQLNTYLVLLTPVLPDPPQSEWKDSLLHLCDAMIKQFFSPGEKLFFPSSNRPEDKALSTAATDFGLNAKALWMIRWTGLITGRPDLVAFAEDNARSLFDRAYLNDCGCWADGMQQGDTLDVDKTWWIYAELSQLAGTLALRDRIFANYLPRTYAYWFRRFVDPVYGEVWNSVDGRTHAPVRKLPKQWKWKNAYHSFEHALVGYIVAQQLHGNPVTLYYAFSGDLPQSVRPYYFLGTTQRIELTTSDQGRRFQKVEFSNVQ